MKTYGVKREETKRLEKIFCNGCGKEIPQVKEGIWEEHFQGEKTWGYFSEFDGREDSFDLCQNCYMKIIAEFRHKIH